MLTGYELAEEMLKRCEQLDAANSELVERSREYAEDDCAYRKARAIAYLEADGRTIPEREAQATSRTADLAMKANLSEGLKVSALEAVRSRRAQLSALQSIANAVKAEAELARTGP